MKLISKIHSNNPYLNFDADKFYNPDIQNHTNNRYGEVYPSFDYALQEVKEPKLLVEVGTYQGASAIFFAKEFQRRNIDCEILCIDTFVGSITHWTQEYFYKDLKQINGFPTLYQQFLSEVIKNKFEDKIIPLPLTSLDGARYLIHNDIKPDLVYIDASHEYPDVLLDILLYYKALKVGGIIFGDDYDGWEGVKNSVDEFCKVNSIELKVMNGKWFIKK